MKYVVSKKGILENAAAVQNQAGAAKVIGVVKGNGYGFGTQYLAEVLRDSGIDMFAVTEVEDLLLLRSGVLADKEKYSVLMLRSTADPAEIAFIADNDGIFTIGSEHAARSVNAYAASKGIRVKAHIKIDTGMGRYGFLYNDADAVKEIYEICTAIDFCGVYTHFSSSFTNSRLTRLQLGRFLSVTGELSDSGYSVGLRHAANSSALFAVPESVLDAVRVGSAFTGRIIGENAKKLTRVGYIESTVIDMKTLPANYPVGYNGTFVTKRSTKLAIVPVGHIDGWGRENCFEVFSFKAAVRRALSVIKGALTGRRTTVQIGDRSYPIAGQIGLSHTAVDVTGGSVSPGDIVKLDTSPLNVSPAMAREYVE